MLLQVCVCVCVCVCACVRVHVRVHVHVHVHEYARLPLPLPPPTLERYCRQPQSATHCNTLKSSQCLNAAAGGFLGNMAAPPPMEDDWMSAMVGEDAAPAAAVKSTVRAGAAVSDTPYFKNKKPWDM